YFFIEQLIKIKYDVNHQLKLCWADAFGPECAAFVHYVRWHGSCRNGSRFHTRNGGQPNVVQIQRVRAPSSRFTGGDTFASRSSVVPTFNLDWKSWT
ncbi:MAG: hypothetical protein AB1705_10090, partial [Verrucomicrobiota bacterium]